MGGRELPLRTGEPADFRRQASTYGRYRRDYSSALYDAVEACAAAGADRRALDLGCGTGFVARSLTARGWRVVGADFSAPMLAEARRAHGAAPPLLRARAESLPLGEGTASLVTCGTAFHWFEAREALAEIARVLEPGGTAALFWRYPVATAEGPRVVREVLARFGPRLPDEPFVVHPRDPFLGSGLVPEPPRVLPHDLEFTAADFHGYVATTELLRRFAGPHHEAFLEALREELENRFPHGIVEPCEEHLFLGRRV